MDQGRPMQPVKQSTGSVSPVKSVRSSSIKLDDLLHTHQTPGSHVKNEAIRKALNDADMDGDGEFSAQEIRDVITNLVTTKNKATHLKHLLWVAGVILIISTGLNAAAMIVVSTAFKDAYADGDTGSQPALADSSKMILSTR